MAERKGPVIPQLPPKTRIACTFGHTIRTRQPPGTQLACTACGQDGKHGVMVTVPAPLPAVRQEPSPTPAGVEMITRRKTGPARYCCSGCHGSTVPPAPGEPAAGWLVLLADSELLARACSAECLARCLPAIREKLADRPWAKPEPGPNGNVAQLMAQVPDGRKAV